MQLEQLLNILHCTESPNHNNETQILSPDAETGEAITWGNYRDKRTVKRLSKLFTTNLGTLAEQKNWRLSQESIIIPELLSHIHYPEQDASYLQAILFLLNSSIGQYYIIFNNGEWLADKNSIFIKDIREIPVPILSTEQISEIVKLQPEAYLSPTDAENQARLDKEIERIFKIRANISIVARDFINFKIKYNKGQTIKATQLPTKDNLQDYGKCLAKQLDEFIEGSGVRHKISIAHSTSLIFCTVEILKSTQPIDIIITAIINNQVFDSLIEEIQKKFQDRFSQVACNQDGIYIFDGATISICKASRLIDWTQTEALNDSSDIIAQVLLARNKKNNNYS